MTKTLLAVDDSVTMRKVLEITFSGEDFTVVTVDNSQAALGAEPPAIAVIDTVLGNEDGYALAKELRKRAPAAAIIMLASRYAPYDQARGRDAGADDWADKPFDTQQLIDKVRKVVLAKEAGGPTPVAAVPPPAPTPQPTPAAPAVATGIGGTGGFRPNPAPAAAAAPSTGASFGLGRGTQPSLGGAPAPGPMPARSPVAAAPAPAPAHAATPAPAPVAEAKAEAPAPSPVAAAVNGQLAGKLGALGLTQQQADAVLALSREVVERVVWEVVPQLAEAIIKEEIARLTKEA